MSRSNGRYTATKPMSSATCSTRMATAARHTRSLASQRQLGATSKGTGSLESKSNDSDPASAMPAHRAFGSPPVVSSPPRETTVECMGPALPGAQFRPIGMTTQPTLNKGPEIDPDLPGRRLRVRVSQPTRLARRTQCLKSRSIVALIAVGADLRERVGGRERQCVDEVPQPAGTVEPIVVALGKRVGQQNPGLVGRRLGERRLPRPVLIQPSQHRYRQPDTIQLDAVLHDHALLDFCHLDHNTHESARQTWLAVTAPCRSDLKPGTLPAREAAPVQYPA